MAEDAHGFLELRGVTKRYGALAAVDGWISPSTVAR